MRKAARAGWPRFIGPIVLKQEQRKVCAPLALANGSSVEMFREINDCTRGKSVA
jgi:hypothetical protein